MREHVYEDQATGLMLRVTYEISDLSPVIYTIHDVDAEYRPTGGNLAKGLYGTPIMSYLVAELP